MAKRVTLIKAFYDIQLGTQWEVEDDVTYLNLGALFDFDNKKLLDAALDLEGNKVLVEQI